MTTDITELAQREKFEAWAHSQKLSLAYGDCGYAFSSTEMAWRAWMASSAALVEALEKAQSANAAQDDHINQQQDRIEQLEKGHQEAAKQITSWVRIAKQNIAEREKDMAELDAARQRIAELESRSVNIKFAPIQVEELGNVRDGKKHPYMFGAGYNSAVIHCESVIQQELDAKGIKWEAE